VSVNNKGLGSVASGLAPDVEDNVARSRRSFVVKGNVAHEVRRYTRIRRSFVASEN